MKHQIIAVDLHDPPETMSKWIEENTHCVWCDASGQWERESNRLMIAFLNEEDDLEFIFHRWAQPVIQLAEESGMSEEDISVINDLIVQVEWIVEDPLHDSESYIRDQFFGFVRLITALGMKSVAEQSLDRACKWMDVRDYFKATDEYGAGQLINAEGSFSELEHEIEDEQTLFLAWNLATTRENNSVSLAPNSLDKIEKHFSISGARNTMK